MSRMRKLGGVDMKYENALKILRAIAQSKFVRQDFTALKNVLERMSKIEERIKTRGIIC